MPPNSLRIERIGGALPDVFGSPDTAAAAIAEKLLGDLERSYRGLLKSGTFNDKTRRALKHHYEQIRAAHDEIIAL